MALLKDIEQFIETKDLQSLKATKQKYNLDEAVIYCAKMNFSEGLEFILNKGANVNTIDNVEKRALIHYAIVNDSIEMLKILIEKRANLNIKDIAGIPPVFYTANSVNPNRIELARILMESGAIINTFDSSNNTILHYCAVNHNNEIAKMAIEKQFWEKSIYGSFWNFISISYHLRNLSSPYKNAKEFIWKYDRDFVNHVNADGYTAHRITLESKNWELCDFLISKGACEEQDPTENFVDGLVKGVTYTMAYNKAYSAFRIIIPAVTTGVITPPVATAIAGVGIAIGAGIFVYSVIPQKPCVCKTHAPIMNKEHLFENKINICDLQKAKIGGLYAN